MGATIISRVSLLALALVSSGVTAQEADESALDQLDKNTPLQALPARQPPGARELQDAMRRIALDPDNPDALSDAGNAALLLGDAKSALNFFTRANAERPRDGRILAGLGSASVRNENPFEALRLFDEAVKLGVSERSIAADRALAFDLLGNFGRAQQDYQLARSAVNSDDLTIRQAISLSLSGQKDAADRMLDPLLQRKVPEAWRARSFILAARGDVRESSKVAAGFLDPSSAQKMDRYLRLLPELTDAQKAAAIHLGHFPASFDIGRDSESVRRIAATIPQSEVATGDSRLIPAGTPLGAKNGAKPVKESKSDKRRREKEEKKLAEANARLKVTKKNEPVKVAVRNDVKTQSAKAQIERAQGSNITAVKSGGLPPPESARPLVDVVGPPAPKPAEVKVAVTQMPASVGPTVISSPPVTKDSDVSSSSVVKASPQQTPPFSANVPPPAPASIGTVSDTNNAAAEAGAIFGPPAPAITPVPIEKIASADVSPTSNDVFISNAAPSVSTPTVSEQFPAPIAATSEVKPTPLPFDLGAIVSAIDIPESEQKPTVAAVDLKKIKPVIPKAVEVAANTKTGKADAKAKTLSNPARNWVQVATGNASAFSYDFKQMAKKNPDLFGGRDGWSSAWGNSERLLVGPFADNKEAKKWEADFRKSGGNGFVWQSADGIVVSKIGGATAPKTASSSREAAKTTAKPGSKSSKDSKTAGKAPPKTSNKTAAKQDTSKQNSKAKRN